MKAVAYSIRSFEKEFLAKANQKKHDITLISNALGPDTAGYAAGKDAVIVYTFDDVSAQVIEQLAALGIRFIVTRSAGTAHIDKVAAATFGIKIANVPISPSYEINNESTRDSFQEIANKTIRTLDLWQQDKCVGDACVCSKKCRIANPTDNKTIL